MFGSLLASAATLMLAMHPSTSAAQQSGSTYVHGTVDVVISTKEGFILATDSRGTLSDGSYSDNHQKAFAVGDRTACVVAGLMGAEIGAEGFRLRDAIGSHLVTLDRLASSHQLSSTAKDVALTFEHGFDSVVGLLNPGTSWVPGVVAGISIVSLSAGGEPEWITFYLPLEIRPDREGGTYLTTGHAINFFHSLGLGLRFDVETLGYPEVARTLIRANQPGENPYSHSKIMRKFYRLKKKGRLDEIRLDDGIRLAKELVEATIALAPPGAGVGGPVDILTVTRKGIRWVARKQNSAPVPPPYMARFFNSTFERSGQDLDGLECVRCVFRDMDLRYRGDGDVQLLGCRFEGACKLTLAPDARQKSPQTVSRLVNLVGTRCQIIEERPR